MRSDCDRNSLKLAVIIIISISGLELADHVHLSGDLPHVLPWPQDAGVHLGSPYTWVTLVVSPAA